MSRFNKKQAALKNAKPKKFNGHTVILHHPDGMVAAQMSAQMRSKLESTRVISLDETSVDIYPADRTVAQ